MHRRRGAADHRDRARRARRSRARTCCCSTPATISRDRCSTRPTRARPKAEFLNQMKFDAMTFGNHEFDDGEDALAPFLDMIKFPVLSANVKANAQSKLGDRIKPSIVLEVGGQKIGIVGARHQRHAGNLLARPEHHHRGRRQGDHRRGREAEGRGRQQDHRADPYRLSARARRDRQDSGHRRRGRRPLAIRCCRTPTRRPKAPTRRWSTIRTATRCRSSRRRPIRNISARSRSCSTTTASSRRPRATRSISTSRSRPTQPCSPASRNSARRSRR